MQVSIVVKYILCFNSFTFVYRRCAFPNVCIFRLYFIDSFKPETSISFFILVCCLLSSRLLSFRYILMHFFPFHFRTNFDKASTALRWLCKCYAFLLLVIICFVSRSMDEYVPSVCFQFSVPIQYYLFCLCICYFMTIPATGCF